MRKAFRATNFFLILFIASCVTVNVYFPAAAVQKAADEVVGEVTKEEPETQAPKKEPSGRLDDFFRSLSIGPREACADVNVSVTTPAIRAIRDSMRNAFLQLKPFYEKGAVGENNNGFMEIRDTSGLNLQERGQVNGLVQQENQDRTSLYREIATANKLGPESIPQIQKIFANSWRDKSHPGWWVQNDNGAWERKK